MDRDDATLPATPTQPPRAVSAPLPMVPLNTPPVELSVEQQNLWRQRAERWVAEARSTPAPASAPLWFAAGRIIEHDLQNIRDAAAMYQEAHKADPSFVPVLRAARRLFTQLGKWQMVVALIDEELALPDAATANLRIERAAILESRLGRTADAVTTLRAALADHAADPAAVAAITRLLSDAGQRMEIWTRAAESCRDPELAAMWLLSAAREAEHTGMPTRAYAEQAALLAPNNPQPLEMLRRIYGQTDDRDQLLSVLSRLTERRRQQGAELWPLLVEQANLSSSTDERHALALLEEARLEATDDPLVLAELARLYERQSMWGPLLEVLETMAARAPGKPTRLALLTEAGRVAEERVQDIDRAVDRYRACLDDDAGYQPALSALGRLYAKGQRYAELAAHYDLQVQAVATDDMRVPHLFKQAEVFAHHLGDSPSALTALRRALTIQPGFTPARQMLIRLLREERQFAELVQVWEAELAMEPEREQAIYLLDGIASVAERELGDKPLATDAWTRLLALQPGSLSALRTVARLLTEQGRFEDLVRVNLDQVQAVNDPAVMLALYTENGALLTDLGRIDDAVASYQRALQLNPGHLPALKALGTTFGRAGRYAELVEMHLQEAEVSRRPDHKTQLLFAAAELTEQRLQDPTAAAQRYRDVLAVAPHHHPSLRAIQRLAVQAGDWDKVVEALRQEADTAEDADAKALLLCRAAEVQDARLGQPHAAMATLDTAIQSSPSSLLAHERLISLLSRLGRADLEAAARARAGRLLAGQPQGRVHALGFAELQLFSLKNPAAAHGALTELLERSPEDRVALRLDLEACISIRDFTAAVATAQRLAAVETDDDEAARLWLQVATWQESVVEPAQDPLPAVISALHIAPQHASALRMCERLYIARQAWPALYELYHREVAAHPSLTVRVDGLLKLAHLADVRLGDAGLSKRHYEEALELDRGLMPAIVRLKELYAVENRPADQLRLSMLEAQTARDPKRAVTTLLELGTLQLEKMNDVDAAIDCFQRALDRAPQDASAFQALSDVLQRTERFGALAEAHRRRAEHATDVAAKTSALTSAAELYEQKLQRPKDAALAMAAVARLNPSDSAAVRRVGDLYMAAEDWDAAIQTFTGLLTTTTDGAQIQHAHAQLGLIALEHRPDGASAVSHLTAALVLSPNDRATRLLLAYAYAHQRAFAQAAQLMQLELSQTTDRTKLRSLHRALAELHEEEGVDANAAATQWEQLAVLADNDEERRAVLGRVVALHERGGNLGGLVDGLIKQAESTAARDPVQAGELFHRAAVLQLNRLSAPDAALKSARRALELTPQSVEVRGFVADLYGKIPNQALLAIEEHRRILRGGHLRLASLHALYAAYVHQRAADRAFCVTELLSFLGSADDSEEFYFQDNRKRVRKDSTESLSTTQVNMWLTHPLQRTAVHELLATAAVDIQGLFTDSDAEIFDRKQRLSSKTDDALRSLASSVAANLGIAPSSFDVVRSMIRKQGVDMVPTNGAPVLLVGADVARQHPTREQRFLLARALVRFSSGQFLLWGPWANRLPMVTTAICRAVDKNATEWAQGADVDALTKRISSALSRKTKAALQEPIAALQRQRPDFEAFMRVQPLSEMRAAHATSGALDASLRLVANDRNVSLLKDAAPLIQADPVLMELVAFHLSDEAFQVRQALRLAIDS